MRRAKLVIPLSIALFVALTLAGTIYVRKLVHERALVLAMKAGDAKTVCRLVRAWPSAMGAMRRECRMPLHWAALSGNRDLVEALLDRGLPVSEAGKMEAAEWLGVLQSHREWISDNATPLQVAVFHGKADVARLLIDRGADVRANYRWGVTCVPTMILAYESGDPATIDLLLKSVGEPIGPEELPIILSSRLYERTFLSTSVPVMSWYGAVDKTDASGRTALTFAIRDSYEDVFKFLLSKGANVNLPDRLGNTPLHHAVLRMDLGMADILLDHGARVDVRNNEGLTPLGLAKRERHPDMQDLLRERGAKD